MGPASDTVIKTVLRLREDRCTGAFPTFGGPTLVRRPTSEEMGAAALELASPDNPGTVRSNAPAFRALAAAESMARSQLNVCQRRAHLLAHARRERALDENNLSTSNAHFARSVLSTTPLEP